VEGAEEEVRAEKRRLEEAIEKNGYPSGFVWHQLYLEQRQEEWEGEKEKGNWEQRTGIPYAPVLLEKILQLLARFKVGKVFIGGSPSGIRSWKRDP
jgi:hypothetical protein